MIPIVVGIAFLVGVIIFIYVIKYAYSNMSDPKNTHNYLSKKSINELDPKKEDVVLAKMTKDDSDNDYFAILWNGTPDKSYSYTITDISGDDPIVIAQGDAKCSTSGLVKIKNIQIEEGKNYQVHVDETSIDIRFEPPQIVSPVTIKDNAIRCSTNVPPTNLEMYVSGEKIPLTRCSIGIDPDNPGVSCEIPENTPDEVSEVVCMVYNGPNAVNIYSGSIS